MTVLTRNNAYIFASSNLRAKEKAGSSAEILSAITNAGSSDALLRAAAKAWDISENAPSEKLLHKAMADAVEDVKSVVPDFSVFAPLLYKYDCTNVKLAIKYRIVGESPTGMLLDCGSIPAEVILKSQRDGNWSPLPPNMKRAAEEAEALYRKTGEARIIDITLDCACFLDMKADAEKGGIPLISSIASLRADTVNVLSLFRLREIGDTSLFKRLFLPTGNIPLEAFIKNGEFADVQSFLLNIGDSPLKTALRAASDKISSIAEIERDLDEVILSLLPPVKYTAYGPEVVVRYLLVREAEVMNCRIMLAAFNSGADSEKIRERMRRSYV